jgi:hypothetical protein
MAGTRVFPKLVPDSPDTPTAPDKRDGCTVLKGLQDDVSP